MEHEKVIEDDKSESHRHQVNIVPECHTMFKLSSLLGDFYLDPTAPQYGRPEGAKECNEYLHTYTDERERHSLLSSAFGARLANMQERKATISSNTPESNTRDWYCGMQKQMAIRTTNNVVYQRTSRAGEPQALREASDVSWKRIEQATIDNMEDDFQELRGRMDRIWFSVLSYLHQEHYEDVLYRVQGQAISP